MIVQYICYMELLEFKDEYKLFESVDRLKSSLPSDIRTIHTLFKDAGYKLYVVGGAVRDALMGDKPKDFDLATDAKPDDIKSILKDYRTNLQGESFGVVVVYTSETPEGYKNSFYGKTHSEESKKKMSEITRYRAKKA